MLISLPFTFIAKILMLLNLFILNRLVKWGMDLPVSALDGSFKNRLDKWADMIPGL